MRAYRLDGNWILMLGEMPAVCEWLEQQRLVPKRVPMHTTLMLDETTNEWVVELYVHPLRVTDDGRVPMVKVRRRVVSLPEEAWIQNDQPE